MHFPGVSSLPGNNVIANSNPPAVPNASSSGNSFVELALGLMNPPAGNPVTSPTSSNVAAVSELLGIGVPSSTPPANASSQPAISDAPAAALDASNANNTSAPSTPSAAPAAPSIYGSLITPAQYLNNVMAAIQSGAPVGGDQPLTVTQALQQALSAYNDPNDPYYAEISGSSGAALIAQIAGANAGLIVPTAAGMPSTPTTPAGWVGDYVAG